GTDLRTLVQAPIECKDSEPLIARALHDLGTHGVELVVATDADREGEAIGMEAVRIVRAVNPGIKVSRAYFSAIIRPDIEDSFQKLQSANEALADSADSRREVDLIWGAVLTRFFSIVSGKLGKDFLSIGRVQTPTLGLVVAREKERRAFKEEDYWEMAALLSKNGQDFWAQHAKGRFSDESQAASARAHADSDFAQVREVSKKLRTLNRPEPFNTTAFLRAATLIGLNAADAMAQAESLYQKGFTSYPRTDNAVYPANLDLRKVLSELAQVAELTFPAAALLSKKELVPSAGKLSQDHPPIYPVSAVSKSRLSPKEWKVYELIARRFLATLSEDAQTENLAVDLQIGSEPFVAHGQVFVRKGWKDVYPYSAANEVLLPPLVAGEQVPVKDLLTEKKRTQPPARYSQSTLIKLMEENGLGTKSTRHVIIQKLFARNYISGLKSIVPNAIAFGVVDTLERHQVEVLRPQMSADMEAEMDEVAGGRKSKQEVVTHSRSVLSGVLDKLLENKNTIGSDLRRMEMADSILGKCDKCENGSLRKIKSKNNKWFLGCTSYPACTNTYPLPQKGKIFPSPNPCAVCGKPCILLAGARYKITFCIDPNCPSKDEWKKKTAAAQAAGTMVKPKKRPSKKESK
ncbi:MAG: DNA topoisomerase I, partial [Candidatus Diapherotrites archaeon]|nr:DNA topoisomerase I [Candidatus Diapherotrites archaeon]